MKYEYSTEAEKEFKRVAIFKRPPIGILIFDSFNNKWFPLESVTIDKVNFSLRLLKDEFHRKYGGNSNTELFMPWHYTIELISKDYSVINTRPIMYKSIVPEFENFITICLTGDTNIDIYSPEFYKVIAHIVINPLHYMPGWKLNPSEVVQYHNIGKNFKKQQLEKNFR